MTAIRERRTNVLGYLTQVNNFLYLLWLFTESNFPTFVLPNTAFGILGALSGSCLTTREISSIQEVLRRLPLVILFNWSNVYIFDLANQRYPESIKEDMINKPWRPLPTGRITPDQTRQLMALSIPAVLMLNFALGAWKETALLFILTFLYNDLKVGDGVCRDLVIAVAFALYNRGSLFIAMSSQSIINDRGYIWIAIISGVILTTMQVQDLKDQVGDRQRGRRTVPLVLGDRISRWMIAAFAIIWSCYCTFFFGFHLWTYPFPIMMGCYVAFRAMWRRSAKEDSRTWKMWCLWTAVLYSLPLAQRSSATIKAS